MEESIDNVERNQKKKTNAMENVVCIGTGIGIVIN